MFGSPYSNPLRVVEGRGHSSDFDAGILRRRRRKICLKKAEKKPNMAVDPSHL